MKKRYFGTDGIRGYTGKHPITAEFMLKLGWAAGRVFSQKGMGQILIGKDTRISGYMFESALEAGLVSAGIDVLLLGPMPTPAIAYLTRTFNALGGIVISASHNDYADNGIKFFSGSGEKLADEIELAIEAELMKAESNMEMVESHKIGKVSRVGDAAGRYIEFCKSCLPSNVNLKGQRIVVDCAHGATYHIAPSVFKELGAEVIAIGVEPNGININDRVGSTEPQALSEKVLETKADYGVAFDGDGDRLAMVDHRGEVVDGDELLYIIASYRKRTSRLTGGVVGTQMSNFGLERALQDLDIPFTRAAVGDRYVMSELHQNNWYIGGESSGHILCLDKTSTGDGIVSALQVIEVMCAEKRTLNSLKSQMKKYPQQMINVRCSSEVVLKPSVIAAVKEAESKLAGKGRVLLRPSGTEPVVRVMIEGEDQTQVLQLTENLAAAVQAASD
ncbi:MAG: phosphoglucosamine mutase [Candidatus Azotimanducaceae bacterium]|jgi:phosphoglucosamine mutase